jgi:hypothetical protein
MGEPRDKWQAMETEMNRFEAEISSLVKPPSFVPTSLLRKPAASGPPPAPPPKATPVVIRLEFAYLMKL